MNMNINFDTPNIIIACYDIGAGGKMILNSLGLSDEVTLQDLELAEQQLNNNLSQQDKFKILCDRLQNTTKVWNDLDLGCKYLFGINSEEYQKNFCFIKESFKFSPIISKLSNSNLRFCLVNHHYPILKNKITVWPNATLIFFDNEKEFVNRRARKKRIDQRLQLFWNNVRGPDWPMDPPNSIEEVENLEPFIQKELTEQFNDEIRLYYVDTNTKAKIKQAEQQIRQKFMHSNPTLVWDCCWSLDTDLFLTNMEIFYKRLGLTNFNPDYLAQFHALWLEKIMVAEAVHHLPT
jgi:hypothetical protein